MPCEVREKTLVAWSREREAAATRSRTPPLSSAPPFFVQRSTVPRPSSGNWKWCTPHLPPPPRSAPLAGATATEVVTSRSLSALKFPHLRQRRRPGGHPLSPRCLDIISVLLYPKTLFSIAWCLSICRSLRIFHSEQERMFLILFIHNVIYGSA
ncbi:hypothetical protein VPH35_112200 [Triticum aestivum]|uniref:Uncharacterized protein n=1 Tax=Triticum turgidum subsp. durum TaxID=4567 RepID=A0A9R1BDJ1_TRITD|nr:unnamed protein product [Triticum turgidum subsp. durum]